jgi:hypothetical protein
VRRVRLGPNDPVALVRQVAEMAADPEAQDFS